MVAEEIYINRPKNFFKNLINCFDDNYDSIIPVFKNRSHNIWKKDDKGDMHHYLKRVCPLNLLILEFMRRQKD